MTAKTKNQALALIKDAYIADLLRTGMVSVTRRGEIINNNWRGKGISKVARQTLQKTGYLYVSLPGKVTAHVSRVVAIAFHGVPVGYCEASHKNGIHTDNRPKNLVWLTPKENTKNSFDAGFNKPLSRVGVNNGRALLNEKQVKHVRRLIKKGVEPKEIARRMGCSRRAIYSIKNGSTWRHL